MRDTGSVFSILCSGIAIGMSIANIVWVSTMRKRAPSPQTEEPE